MTTHGQTLLLSVLEPRTFCAIHHFCLSTSGDTNSHSTISASFLWGKEVLNNNNNNNNNSDNSDQHYYYFQKVSTQSLPTYFYGHHFQRSVYADMSTYFCHNDCKEF